MSRRSAVCACVRVYTSVYACTYVHTRVYAFTLIARQLAGQPPSSLVFPFPAQPSLSSIRSTFPRRHSRLALGYRAPGGPFTSDESEDSALPEDMEEHAMDEEGNIDRSDL